MSTTRTQSVAILVTTYRRNAKLLRLVAHLRELIADYRGPNRYFICVADSDRANSLKLPPSVSYVVNTGEGFDDNLIGAFKALSGAADFVFAMGDDDLPNLLLNPLPYIDAALNGQESDVVLFNHISYKEAGDIHLGDRYFRVSETVNLSSEPMSILTHRLPRYIAIVYRMAFIDTLMPRLPNFRATLHAYALPVLVAAGAGRFRFVDFPVCLFDRADKEDGAWEDRAMVTEGLRVFLQNIRGLVSEADLAKMEKGFRHNYFERPEPSDAGSAQAEPTPAPTRTPTPMAA